MTYFFQKYKFKSIIAGKDLLKGPEYDGYSLCHSLLNKAGYTPKYTRKTWKIKSQLKNKQRF